MKRIYVVVPKTLRTNPPTKVTCGYAAAQIHHATVKAAKRFKLSHLVAVIVLQTPNTRSLEQLSLKLTTAGIKHDVYREHGDLFAGTAITALVTNVQPGRTGIFNRMKLWSCESHAESVRPSAKRTKKARHS